MTFKLAKGVSPISETVGPISDKAYRSQKFDEAIAGIRNGLNINDPANNYSVIGAYTSIYQRISTHRQQVIRDVDEIQSMFYLVDVILNQLTEDALSPEIGTGQVINVKYPKDKKIEKILQKLERDLDLDELLINICPDLCKYGEYILETKIDEGEEFEDELNPPFDATGQRNIVKNDSKGLVEIRDVVEQGTVIQLAHNGKMSGYLALTADKRKIVKRANNRYVKFILAGSRVRIKLEEFIPHLMTTNKKVQEILKNIPRFVRIGRSLIHSMIPKFKELILLEKLVPATKLSKLSNVNLIGVQVPAKYDLNSGFETARRMESYINNKVGVDERLGEITVESILSVAGRTKVLPLFGDKGNVEKIDHQSDEPDDLLTAVKDIREVILDSIGIPYELVYKSESESKGEILKRNAKYLRKLKNIQRSLSEGAKNICAIHLEAMGIDFNLDDIEIEFRNKLIEIDNLDRIEHADVTVSALNNIINFFNEISAEDHPLSPAVDLNAVANFVDRNLKTIGLSDAFKTRDEGGVDLNRKPKSQDDDSDIDPEPDSSNDNNEPEDDLDEPQDQE